MGIQKQPLRWKILAAKPTGADIFVAQVTATADTAAHELLGWVELRKEALAVVEGRDVTGGQLLHWRLAREAVPEPSSIRGEELKQLLRHDYG